MHCTVQVQRSRKVLGIAGLALLGARTRHLSQVVGRKEWWIAWWTAYFYPTAENNLLRPWHQTRFHRQLQLRSCQLLFHLSAHDRVPTKANDTQQRPLKWSRWHHTKSSQSEMFLLYPAISCVNTVSSKWSISGLCRKLRALEDSFACEREEEKHSVMQAPFALFLKKTFSHVNIFLPHSPFEGRWVFAANSRKLPFKNELFNRLYANAF